MCIDEAQGRRYARALGLEVTGTLGLLVRAKSTGVFDRIEPIIERLQGNGVWFRAGLVERVLRGVGERS